MIILRHGEKANGYALTAIGQQRALALQANYLGKNAAQSLFPDGTAPAAIFAITLHSLELISPAAQSWDMPIQLYSVVPGDGCTQSNEVTQLNQRTQQAAHDILTNPRRHGKTLVIAWEHDHIAREALEQQFPNERVTLRQLLNLDQLPPAFKVPTTWPGDNYDYFWIVVYPNPESPIPNAFTMQKQIFPAPYQHVPSNDWGQPEPQPAAANQFRLFLHSAAYVILHELRARYLQGTELATARFSTIRQRLIKIGTRVEVLKTAIRFFLPASFPLKDIFAHVCAAFRPLRV